MPDMPETAVPEEWKKPRKTKVAEGLPDNPDNKEATPESPTPTERKPEFGDSVRYVDNRESSEQELDATIMVVFADKTAVNLRVLDPENVWGHFDVAQVEHDVEKHPGTWHFKDE